MSKQPRPVTNPTQSDPSDGPIRFWNDTSGSLTRGTLVYLSGWNATAGLPTVTKADADAAGKEAQWVVLKTVADATPGVLGKFLHLTGQNTSGATSAGDPVYLSATAGGWTATSPAAPGAIVQVVGFVSVKHASTGVVEFRLAVSPRQIGTNEIEDGAVMAAKLGSDVSNLTGVDNSTIELNGGNLRVKDSGITAAKLGVTAGTATASKALVLDANKAATGVGALGALEPVATASGDGAIAIAPGVVKITKGSAAALTLADPAAGDEGTVIRIVSTTAFGHTISNAAGSGFNAGGAASDVGTLGGAIGDGMSIVALGSKWYVLNKTNVTLA